MEKFKKELKELLEKHNAFICLEYHDSLNDNDYKNYYMTLNINNETPYYINEQCVTADDIICKVTSSEK